MAELAGLWSPRPIGAGSPRFSGVGPATPHADDSEKLGTYGTGAILAGQEGHALPPGPGYR